METKLSVKEIVCGGMFTALVAAGAFIQVPVPGMDYFTLQFLFVLLAGMILGYKLGAISVAVYVLLGLCGLPIFAAGGGIAYIFRPSFGYLVGFILAAFATGLIVDKTLRLFLLLSTKYLPEFVLTKMVSHLPLTFLPPCRNYLPR